MFEGHSVGRTIILLGYFTIVIFALLYKSNPFKAYVRAGFVAAAQVPIVVALGTKNNVIGRFLSMGYEKVSAVRFSLRLRRPAQSSRRINPSSTTFIGSPGCSPFWLQISML